MAHDIDLNSISLPKFAPRTAGGENEPTLAAMQGNDCAQVNKGTLLSFNGSVSAQGIEDISNSILFAQLAADHEISQTNRPSDWPNSFLKTLSRIGWVENSMSHTDNIQSRSIDFIGTMARTMPPDVIGLVKRSIKSHDLLPRDSKQITIWNESMPGLLNAHFNIGSAKETGSTKTLFIAVMHLQYNPNISDFLSFNITCTASIKVARFEINESICQKIRNPIIDKLGDRPKYLIAPLPLK